VQNNQNMNGIQMMFASLTKTRVFKAHGYGIWSSLLTPNECKCSGKYYNRCNSDYCALDKRACGEMKRNMDSIEKVSKLYKLKKKSCFNIVK
jgi:hypothetical protein